jgi:hypothetical protein
MRRFLSLLGAAAVSAVMLQPAFAEYNCISSTEQATFDVQALRSELMVLATGCQDDAQYNAFIRRYQPDLLANDHAVDAYFKRKYGRRGQVEHDRFVTELANALSRRGSQLGTDFCPRNGQLFTEVMALPGASELPDYAAGKDLLPPAMGLCPEVAEAPKKAAPPRKRPVHPVHSAHR